MSKKILMAAACAALVVACGGTSAGSSTSASPEEATTISTAPTSTSGPTTTSASGVTSTTTAATTSTSAAATSTTSAAPSGDLASIQAALDKSSKAVPARIEGTISIVGLGAGGQDVEMPMAVAFDAESGNSSFLMDLSGMAQASGEEVPPGFESMFGEFEMREIGNVSYVKFPFFNMFLGAKTPWISMPAEEGSGFAEDFSSGTAANPAAMLESLAEAEGSIEVLGTETLRGVETTHYRVVIDAEQWRSQMSAEELAELNTEELGSVTEIPLELWIDGDGLVHRYSMEIDGSQIEDAPPEEQFESMVTRFDFFDFGAGVSIEAPPADQVTDIEQLESAFGTPSS